MIKINNDLCCGCGHCQFIRFTLPLVKTVGRVDYYEDPRPEDRQICGEYRHGVLGQRYEYRINAPS